MKKLLINYRAPIKFDEGLALCLGYFDGVHLGHVALLKHSYMNLINDGEDNLALGVLTFSNPISRFKDTGKAKEILTTVDDRFHKISNLKLLDYFLVMYVDQNFTNLSAEDFIEVLEKMNVKQVFCGSDYQFGKDGLGDVNLLKKHFVVNVLDVNSPLKEKISTHTIIEHIKNGKVNLANEELGYNYIITGKVIQGKKKGREIGFPTLNIKPNANYVLPKIGVYKSRVVVGIHEYLGLTNIGYRPTLDYKDKQLTIETHLLDAELDEIYGEEVKITFEKYIRDEKKFASINELKAQIKKDIETIKPTKTIPMPTELIKITKHLVLKDNLARLYEDFGYDPVVISKIMCKAILTVRGFFASEELLKDVITKEEYDNLKKFIETVLKR